MKNIILIATVITSLQSVFAQHSEINFIDSDRVIEDIRRFGVNSEFYPDLDYEALVYLHPNEFELLNKLKPKTLHLTRYENLPGAIRDLPFHSKEIKNLFIKEEKLRQIIGLVSPETDFRFGDIYFRSPDKVFINIIGDRWSSSYGFLLEGDQLKLKYEVKNIE